MDEAGLTTPPTPPTTRITNQPPHPNQPHLDVLDRHRFVVVVLDRLVHLSKGTFANFPNHPVPGFWPEKNVFWLKVILSIRD